MEMTKFQTKNMTHNTKPDKIKSPKRFCSYYTSSNGQSHTTKYETQCLHNLVFRFYDEMKSSTAILTGLSFN